MGATLNITYTLSEELSDEQITENAKTVLEYPSDFGYFGNDKTLWVTRGPTIGRNRDSTNLENAAFEIAWETLCEEFPDLAPAEGADRLQEDSKKLYVFGCSHWAVGWTEQIIVPVLKVKGEITLANIHPAFVKALELGLEFPHLEEADTRADDLNWEAVKEDIAKWQEFLADREADPYVKAFSADELLSQLSRITHDDEDISNNYMVGDEDSIPFSWYYDAKRENEGSGRRIFGVLELHALACWDEAHREVDGQEPLS
jgi:hypothetical protein